MFTSPWERAERILTDADLMIARPGRAPRPIPDPVDLLVLDFDGVLTDDRVWVNEQGEEAVAAHRGDGYGIGQLRERGLDIVVLSREENPVVSARCQKLGIPAVQGVKDKASGLKELLAERSIESSRLIT